MNCFCMNSEEVVMDIKGNTQSIQYWTWKVKPWTLRKNYSSETSEVVISLKVKNFQKSRITVWSVPVSGKCLWLVFSELFEERQYKILKELILGEGGDTVTCKKENFNINVTAVEEGNFPNFNLTCKENSVHYHYSLICLVWKAEMWVKC